MTIDLYLNGATLMTTPTDRLLRIARETGYRGIEARAERLLVNESEAKAAAETVGEKEVWSVNGVLLSLRSDGAMDRGRLEADLGPRLQLCRDLGATYLLAVPPRMAGVSISAAMRGTREALELVRDRAAARGIGTGFEFLGFNDCPINSPALAAETVDPMSGIDVVLDSCHWHASGGLSLAHFPVDRTAMVHLNDVPAKPLGQLEDADRVMPGDGVIRLSDLVRELAERGYRGPWSLETFNPGFWSEDPAGVAKRGYGAMARLLQGSP